ncbi:MAG: PAS domain-containing protein, partial [Clostridia bacterium]|nr:PAS domain-containing protein [Clostridia bacterium]
VWTNGSHNLFYGEFVMVNGAYAPASLGIYAYVHLAYSYVCMIIGLGYMSYFAIKNSAVWSAQATLIIIGSVIPLATNVIYTLNALGIVNYAWIDGYSTPIAFTFTLGLYLLGMFRFNLLRITPVALQTVINRISDSFIVVDTEMNIIDYNKTFEDNFHYITNLQKGENFYKLLLSLDNADMGAEQFKDIVTSAAEANDTLIKDIDIEMDGKKQFFTIEFTPISQRGRNTAVILLYKNVTQQMNDMQQIQDNQSILLERERLASLGQLIGGIAHNLKTPIMSVAGGIDQIKYLSEEYVTSLDDAEVTKDDHKEIAGEMQDWLTKMKVHMGYMSDIITTVKDQAAKFTNPEHEWFTLDEAFKRVNILMQHEITANKCRYTEDVQADRSLRIEGDINSMVQIMDNIIVNAIQSYGKKGGEIAIRVTRKENNLLIVISDFGKGIKDDVKERLFKEMVTTKGKMGTGLGLYMSYSTIKGMFRGEMWVESSVGVGTDFYIQLPIHEDMVSEVE